ncbi:MAG: efflux RND transporter permease subunit [Planctomycetota bacterium]|nr:MAG: efflux RND transporter permease subunit [Planctomycetota bacterium]
MNPVRFAVERPHTVAVGVVLALVFSFLAFRRIPVQLKPSVDRPVITIMTLYPGAGPVEVEEQVTRKIEEVVQGVDGLEKLTSSSIEGMSTVRLEYRWGIDKDRAVVDVVTKMNQLPPLPPDAEEPVVSLVGEMAERSMWLVARSGMAVDRLRQLVVEEVEPRLERIGGVADLLVVGGEEREIRVLADPERLAGFGVRWDELAAALQRGFLDLRGGTVEAGSRRLTVRTEGRRPEIARIEEIAVRRGPAGTVRVGDLARVVDGHKELTGIVRNDGRRTVVIGVGLEVGANVVEMTAGVDRALAELNDSFAGRGLDVVLEPVYRDTTYLDQALAFVGDNLALGSLLAVFVLVLFLRSLRSVLVVAVAIPISLLTVFLVLDALGRTLNVISLAGLAFAAGMVVDNAIVVLENIFRHVEKGADSRTAAAEGGREVWGGVLASTLTTVAVFVPILGIKEEAGQLFADLSLAIAAAVALSLVVALTVIPALAALLYRRGLGPSARVVRIADGAAAGRRRGPLQGAYGATVAALTGRGRGSVLLKLGLLAFALTAALASSRLVPPAGYLPAGNVNLTFFFGQPIPGTRPEALEAAAAPMERWLQADPDVDRYFFVLAPAFNGGGVMLKPEATSPESQAAFRARFAPLVVGLPGFLSMYPFQAPLFQDAGAQFTIEVEGPEFDQLAAAAKRIEGMLYGVEGVQYASSDYVEGRPELKVRVDEERAAEAGMGVAQVAAVVEAAVAGRRVGTFAAGGRDYDLVLVAPAERVASAADLAALPLVTPNGRRTTIGDLARIEVGSGPVSVNRSERQRAITLTVHLAEGAVLESVLDRVREQVVRPILAELPPEYGVRFGGSADKFSATLSALTGSFWLAVLICYLLLVALFRSWLSPLVILVSVPLALSGGLFGMAVSHALGTRASYDLLAMLGFVILAGIVVNNAILIVHQANNLRQRGMERRRALAEAAESRLRPILMSVTTSVFGMLPLAALPGAGAELYQGLAAVVVGGLVVSTVFTLAVVPALLSLGWDLAEALGAGRGGGEPAPV